MKTSHSSSFNIFRSPVFYALLAFCLVVVLSRVLWVSMDDVGRTHARGDASSELGSLSAGNYWLDHGYTSTYFRPMYNYSGDPAGASVYLHYPPASELMASLYMKLTGSRDVQTIRGVAVAVSFLFVFLLTFLLTSLLRNGRLVLWVLIFFLPTNYFLAFADNLYVHALAEMLKVVYVALLYRHYIQNRPWPQIIPLAMACVFFGQISPTFTIFCAVATVGFSIGYKKGIRKIFAAENWLLGLGFVGGVTIHLTLNRLYLGSWEAVFQDLTSILKVRGALPFSEKLTLPLDAINRIERNYIFPGWALIVLHWFFLKYCKERRDLKILSWTLLAAGLAWYPVMAQHAKIHSYIAREIGLYVMLVGGVGSWAYFQFLRSRWSQMSLKLRSLNAIFVFYILTMTVTQQLIPVWWTHGLSHWFH